ncbi:MAG: hypothetical protein IJ125_07060 [Atopobiaceae bacterium]|nr:hypothetical protein [Atopobiaceae bacterium]
MTAYDYLRENGYAPSEAEQVIINRGSTAITALSKLRTLCSGKEKIEHDDFIKAATEEYAALKAATNNTGIMSEEAFMEVAENIWKDTPSR